MCEISNDSIRAGNRGSSKVSCISSSTRFMSGLSTRKRCAKASFSFYEGSFQQLTIIEINSDVNLAGHKLGGTRILRVIHGRDARATVVLRQHFAQKFCRIEIFCRQIFPEEFAPSDDVAFAHGEQLQRQTLAFAIVAKDIQVALSGGCHLLLLGK